MEAEAACRSPEPLLDAGQRLGRISVALLFLLFPIVLVPLAGPWTVAIMALAAFFVVIGESTAAVIENPFGTDPNALDLTRICQVIETTVGEILTASPLGFTGAHLQPHDTSPKHDSSV